MCEEGVIMMSGTKHVEGVLKALGADIKERDAPANASVAQSRRSTRSVWVASSNLSHMRADIQFSVSVADQQNVKANINGYEMVGSCGRVPQEEAKLDYVGEGALEKALR